MSEINLATNFRSSQEFVRTLKSASDPPVAGGPCKLEIAQEAWNNQKFYVPNKGEIIAEWVLGKFLKEKGGETSSNPIFDARYWQLTLGIIAHQLSEETRSVKTWLTPLLHRIPQGPVVAAFLDSFNDTQVDNKDDLADVVSASLSILWPVALQRMSVELLQECFGALLMQRPGTTSRGIHGIGHIVASSYRSYLVNSSNKRKLHQSFLQAHLGSWLRCIAPQEPVFDVELTALIHEAGTKILFNLDILRHQHDASAKAENNLLQQLCAISLENRELVLRLIPVLYRDYIAALTRHRGALFSQSSQGRPGGSLNELRQFGITAFTSFMGVVEGGNPDQLVWETKFALLQAVDQENLFDRQQKDAQVSFNHIMESIVAVLDDSRKEAPECATLGVQCLSTIARIDYDFLSPFIPRVLPRLLEVQISSDAHFLLLDSILQHHVKTRTILALIETLFSSFSALSAPFGSARESYQLYFSSPVMHDHHLHRLSKALQFFTTEAQCLPMIQFVFDVCKTSWQRYGELPQKDVSNDSPKKKRKSMNADNSSSGEALAVTYALVARMASVVLSSLPIKSLSSDTQEKVRTSLEDFRSTFIEHSISKPLKSLKKREDTDVWAPEVSLVANLRFLYALGISGDLSLSSHIDAEIQAKILSLVAQDGQLPELTLELFRALFYCMSFKEESDHEETIDKMLDHLEKHFSPSHVHWSGQSYHLTNSAPGRSESAFAILHMVFDRWLPDVDRLASTEQLKRLLKLVMAINLSVTSRSGRIMLPEDLLIQLLHSAQFWEFRNIRDVFVDLLRETTAPLDNVDSKPKKISAILEKASIYRLFLFFPVDYFSPRTLGHLTKYALQADFALTQPPSSVGDATVEALILLRVFLKRAYAYSGSRGQEPIQDQSTDVLHFLNERHTQNERFRDEFIRVTLDLTDIYFMKLLKGSSKNPSALQNVLAAYNAEIFVMAPGITSSSFTRLVDILTRDFSVHSMHESVRADLRRLYNTISSPLLLHISSFTAKRIQQANISNLVNLVTGWHSLLCLDKWLGSSGMTTLPCIGRYLAAMSISSIKAQPVERNIQVDELCLIAHSILLQEVDHKAEADREDHLDAIVATHIAFAEVLRVDSLSRMGTYLAKICRKIVLSDYIRLLSTVSDFLSTPNANPDGQLRHLVQLASLLVREHPSYSLVHTQKFMTKCIGIFTGHSVFVEGPQTLRLQVLDMVAQHCADQQAALRSLDVAGIWLLISKFLAPSKDHDEATQPEIFQHIIMTISPLIRLRRDLVTLSLPHLGFILRQLLLSLRACRPHLGPKQLSLVMNTQPRWISSVKALGPEEAKALGRLLESLTTKTTMRLPTSSILETQKAESLARPFSKHAAYVLKAYIEAMNDPLCVLSLEVRQELESGLFVLCGMMSEHSRDALMVSALDAGGKATLKALWKEYEKQRYVGRG
ncbi:unnamed protein product [Cyclocybe aegerita]|uniref:Nucleolar 27S pre-rRNA processing Urb2/Npa2 C-terminal domain-containing protein n=1 Tax=Cyclocybe aegerita TaxID=1973307 RepID=A0A8S0VW39_CYCAE|nr:unnamed protein product [Cyclocybe aegerita]